VKEVIETLNGSQGKDGHDETDEGPVTLPVWWQARENSSELGWRPKYPNLEVIIRTAWEWHCQHREDMTIDL